MQQYMMRARVAAQGGTIVAVAGGVLYMLVKDHFQKDKQQKVVPGVFKKYKVEALFLWMYLKGVPSQKRHCLSSCLQHMDCQAFLDV